MMGSGSSGGNVSKIQGARLGAMAGDVGAKAARKLRGELGKLGRRLLESKNLPKEGLDVILVR